MAELITIARPYARALFQDACESGTFADWQAALEALVVVVNTLSAHQLIGNPNVTMAQLQELCFSALKSVIAVQPDFAGELQRFIALLLDEKRLVIVPQIAELYHSLVAAHNKVVEAEVTSAAPLSEAQKQQLVLALERRFNQKVTAQYTEDPALIGGLVIKSDDWVFDGSVRSKLTRLAERII